MATAMLPTPASAAPPRYGTGYRSDLQGVRAIAVLLVLLYHSQIPLFSGGFIGVDVFFVLSGFLITGIVAREVHETAGFSLSRFYGRRVVRIVPAATVVLVFVAITSFLWLPVTRWRSIAAEIAGSALYVSNWQFAASTNYLNAEAAPSPLQHFWSLAVEEQYYLIWPALLLFGVFLITRRARRLEVGARTAPMIRFAAVLMTVITVSSFAFSLIAMKYWPASAYFITPTRLWELGVGSLLALAVPHLRNLATALKWVLVLSGATAVLAAGVLYDRSTPFPGATALVPVLGTAAIIAGGLPSDAGARIRSVLDAPVLVWIGNHSYSLYLWHWPLIVLAEGVFGYVNPAMLATIATLSAVPAYLSTRFIENPLLRRRALRDSPAQALRLGAAAIVVSLVSAAALLAVLTLQVGRSADSPSQVQGASALSPGEIPAEVTAIPDDLMPSLVDAAADNPRIYAEGCHLEVSETKPKECSYGKDSAPLILLTGDSHAAQWFPALEALSAERGYHLVSMTKSSCPFVAITIELVDGDRPYTECAQWNENVREYIAATRPVAVFTGTLGSYLPSEGASADSTLETGLRQSWEWTAKQGSRVIALVDTPYMISNVPECLARHTNDPSVCRTPSSDAFPHSGLETRAAEGLQSVDVIDLNGRICPGRMCEPIIGNALVYRDQHHLSATYARTLAPYLEEKTEALLPPGSRQ